MILSSGDSTLVVHPVPPAEGGSIPTSPLQLRKHEWEVASADQTVARHLVETYHYAKGASNTFCYLHGLFPSGWNWHAQCEGVAWYIPPTKSAAQAWAGDDWKGVLSLSRLVISPLVPKNACSFLLSKSVKMIDRNKWHTLVSYADNWRGHTGAIYKAAGWEYCGETKPERVYSINGRMTARKAGQKTRTHQQMLDLGAICHGSFSKARFRLRLRDMNTLSKGDN